MRSYRFRCAGIWVYLDADQLEEGRIVSADKTPLPGCQQCSLDLAEGCEVYANSGVDLQLHCSNCGQVYVLQVVQVHEETPVEEKPAGSNGAKHPENCLLGMSCPSCHQNEEFRIEASAIFTVTDDGTDSFTDVTWCAESYVECPECKWTGTVKDLHLAGLRAQAKPQSLIESGPPSAGLLGRRCTTCGAELGADGFCAECDELPEGM